MARNEKLVRCDYRCSACGRDCSRERGRIVVHHVLGARRFPEYALDQRFLEPLCTTCHDTVERCIRYLHLAELVDLGLHPDKVLALHRPFGPVQWQQGFDFEAANDDDFTLDPPVEVPPD